MGSPNQYFSLKTNIKCEKETTRNGSRTNPELCWKCNAQANGPRDKSCVFAACLLQFKRLCQITQIEENWHPKDIQKSLKSTALLPLGMILKILGPFGKKQFIYELCCRQKSTKNPTNAANGPTNGGQTPHGGTPAWSSRAPPLVLLI